MKPKNIVTVALLVFVTASVAFLLFKESAKEAGVTSVENRGAGEHPVSTERRGDTRKTEESGRKVIAYYFHTTKRCATCRKIEAYTTESIKTTFARQLKSGSLEFHIVNVDDPGKNHYIEDYQLTTKSVVLADYRDGEQTRWKNLDRVWQLVKDKQAFLNYIESETRDFLGEPLYE